MKITILGGGPAGLYAAILIKKAAPAHDITIIERNPAGVTYGWGVVFSDRTLASFQRADYKTYQDIADNFVIWDAIDVRYRAETIRCGGHVISSISRKALLNILERRCAELGVALRFDAELTDVSQVPDCDLLIAADGVNSIVRRAYEDRFKPSVELGSARYIWLGADKVLDAFNFIFHETEHGLFQVHAYPFSGTTSTFIVECSEQVWLNAGLDKATEAESLAFCQRLLDKDLHGAQLLSNNSRWINFPTLKVKHWHVSEPRPTVLMGDAVHTAHFSIGSGTKLAMEDAIALANALEQHPDLETALNEYEIERKPVVETFQRAAAESQTYFETIKRYLDLDPMTFAFQLLTRSGRINYDDLHFRDAHFGDEVDRRFFRAAICDSQVENEGKEDAALPIAPRPVFAPIRLRSLLLPNRMVVPFGAPGAGVAFALTGICAVSVEGRITPEDEGMYAPEHLDAWSREVEAAHKAGRGMGVQLGHAGRRGAVRPSSEGLDRPLREGAWPLISASAIPYTPRSQVPREMDRADMDSVLDDFVRAARMAADAGFDLLQLHFARGYLLASFLSPFTNARAGEYGGSFENRVRFPLEVFEAVRAAWPDDRPISVAITATDNLKGGLTADDAVAFAAALRERGCDVVQPLAGQTTPDSDPAYGRGFLTHYSDRIRNEAGIRTMVGGYITTGNEANTILAAGRADLVIMTSSE